MGWLTSIVMLFVAAITGNEVLMITSGLFAIAGSIGGGADIIKKAIEKSEKKPSENTTGYSFLD